MAAVVQWGIVLELVPRRPIFEKCSHLREKGAVLMLLKTNPHLLAKKQYLYLLNLNLVDLDACLY
jgi:ATP-dependent protease Clp ATPase subunit